MPWTNQRGHPPLAFSVLSSELVNSSLEHPIMQHLA